MKKTMLIIILVMLITSCSTSKLKFVDNGQPGKIKVVVLLDANRSGAREEDKSWLHKQVSLSQDVSCPTQSRELVDPYTSDANGEAFYESLDPGKYCISYHGGLIPTIKLAFEVPLSREQEIIVYLGLTDNKNARKFCWQP